MAAAPDSIASRRAAIQGTGYVFAAAIADEVEAGNQQAILNALRSIRRVPEVRQVIAIDSAGREIASLGSASMLQSDIVGEKTGWYSLLTRGWFPVVTEIVKAGKPVGRLLIVADIRSFRTQVAQAAIVTLLAALVAGGLGVAAALRLQQRISGPIASLTRAMTHIRGARDYSLTVEHESDDETGVLVDAFNGMISEIGYRDESMRRLAHFDPLTGLPNRGAFQRHLESVLSESKVGDTGAALFLLDLDQFKGINDSYGHSAGDSLLMDVASRFKEECPDNLFLVRLGGDEFAVVATGVATESDAQTALAPLIASLLRPVDIFGHQILIGASVGVALILTRRRQRRPTCCGGPTWRCTRPSVRAGAASYSIAPGWTRTCSCAPRWRRISGRPLNSASSKPTTSRKSTFRPARLTGSRVCCAGAIRFMAMFRPPSSFPLPKAMG